MATPFSPGFVDRRRQHTPSDQVPYERRQFGNSYSELSPEAKELALAIDSYKLMHHRRFVTYEELLQIIKSLGYRRQEASVPAQG